MATPIETRTKGTGDPQGWAMVKQDISPGLWRQTPPLLTALGLCPALAVTTAAIYGMVMGLATSAVLVGSALLISTLRRVIPKEIRIPIYALTIATLVTVADLLLSGLVPGIHRILGLFVPLIVVNCMILGRIEGFASRTRPGRALMDSLGYGLGFTWALTLIGGIRELLGAGTLFGAQVMPAGFVPWGIMQTPPGAFLTMGVLVALIMVVRNARRGLPVQTRRATPSVGSAPAPREV